MAPADRRTGPDPRTALARRQRLEVLGGVVGFFTVLAVVNAVGLIVAGKASAVASIVLVAMLALCWATWRAWRAADRATRGE